MGIHRPFSRPMFTLQGSVLTSGGAKNLAKGQFTIVQSGKVTPQGAEVVEDDDEVFADKMQKLTKKLGEQMAKGTELDALIQQNLGGLGYEF